MQIFNKYEKDYRRSCEKFRLERSLFLKELESVPNLRVYPSQANYFLCELTGAVSSAELTLQLLTDFNILIKDCSTKKGFPQGRQFIRLAIRDRNDNSLLASALAKCLTN